MALYLVQHGLALPKAEDPAKGLSVEGRAQTERIAEVARCYGVRVSGIYHSGKARALQTAEIFERYLAPPAGLSQKTGMGPLDDVDVLAEPLDLSADWMLVGHLPSLESLTAYLITGTPTPVVFKFQNSGIVCIDIDPRHERAVIKWSLMPNIG